MKKHSLYWTILLAALAVTQCSKDSEAPAPLPEPPAAVILDPTTPTLSFPDNNAPCLESTAINDVQSSVTFRWSATQNTNAYTVVLVNLLTSTTQRFNSSTNQLAITLTHAEPYAWKVTSIGESGSNPAESATWKFYLAGPAEEDYAPFPPELTTPVSGSTITPVNGRIELQWNCSDVDNDLITYQVYLDKEDATTLVQSIDYQSNTTAIQVEVDNNSIYYWKVIAIDAAGNQSQSGVYAFRTN